MEDNEASAEVTGSITGTLAGGNTEDVQEAVGVHGAFHLDGSTQYVTIPLVSPLMRSDEIQNLWTNHENDTFSDRPILELCAKPGGGWYRFGVQDAGVNAIREESTDLITWTNRVTVMSGAEGEWDEIFNGVLAFQKPDGSWVMLYRGAQADGGGIQPGIAFSADGNTFTRRDNGGTDDGLWDLPTGDYDPFACMKVGDRYYIYTNGDPTHGHLNVLYTDDDFATVQRYGTEPIFNNGFCPFVWKQGDYYYILICRDLNDFGSALYDHGIALYRSPVPTFDYDNREYLGYAIINNEEWSARYLDVPSMPFTDIYRTTLGAEFEGVLNCLYTAGMTGGYGRATMPAATIDALTAIPESASEVYARTVRSLSFCFQMDTMVANDVMFSIGRKVDDSYPVMFAAIKGTALNLYLEGGFRSTSLTLTTNEPYHVVIVDGLEDVKVYINSALVGTLEYNHLASFANNLYIGKGEGGDLDGYVWDFRIYDGQALTQQQVTKLYATGRV